MNLKSQKLFDALTYAPAEGGGRLPLAQIAAELGCAPTLEAAQAAQQRHAALQSALAKAHHLNMAPGAVAGPASKLP